MPADADPVLVGHAQNAGWQSPLDAVKSHRELQQLLGADRAGRTITVPADEADAKGWEQVFTKLGRPANPQDYGITAPEGADPAFSQAAAAQMHALGLSKVQAQKLVSWWNEHAKGVGDAQTAADAERFTAEDAQLTKDWGAERPMRTELARRAAQKLGWSAEDISRMEKVAGFAKTMKTFAQIGDMLREHGMEGLGDIGGFGTTPEGAKAKRAQLLADSEFRTKAMADSKSSQWAEIQRLDRIIAGA